MLDKSKPFGTVHGFTEDGCKYVQDNKRYKADGLEIKPKKKRQTRKIFDEPNPILISESKDVDIS